jgi:hypothetical protein
VEDLLVGGIRRVADASLLVSMAYSEVFDMGQDGACTVLFTSSGADV